MRQFLAMFFITVLSVTGIIGVVGLWDAYILWSASSMDTSNSLLFASMVLLITCSYERVSAYYIGQCRLIADHVA